MEDEDFEMDDDYIDFEDDGYDDCYCCSCCGCTCYLYDNDDDYPEEDDYYPEDRNDD